MERLLRWLGGWLGRSVWRWVPALEGWVQFVSVRFGSAPEGKTGWMLRESLSYSLEGSGKSKSSQKEKKSRKEKEREGKGKENERKEKERKMTMKRRLALLFPGPEKANPAKRKRKKWVARERRNNTWLLSIVIVDLS